jgi:hypothetical protein
MRLFIPAFRHCFLLVLIVLYKGMCLQEAADVRLILPGGDAF